MYSASTFRGDGRLCYPPLLRYTTQAEFRRHFEEKYCERSIFTFDGIRVRFRKNDFDHCCFESSQRNGVKDAFSANRAARLDWIEAALQDKDAERYIGWSNTKKRYDRTRRVTVVMQNYVVIIALLTSGKARFITAFVADTPPSPGRPSTIQLIRRSPKWT